jgi:hypothetical protein
MIVVNVTECGGVQRFLTEEDHALDALLLDGSHEAFKMRTQSCRSGFISPQMLCENGQNESLELSCQALERWVCSQGQEKLTQAFAQWLSFLTLRDGILAKGKRK